LPNFVHTVDPKRAVFLFAGLGYAYLLVLVLLLAGVTIFLFLLDVYAPATFVGMSLALFIFALFIRVSVPEGYELTAEEAPELFRLISQIGSALAAPKPHKVILTGDINAAVVDLPRFALFGSRRWLIIGLPLLHLLSQDEVRALLAHEFAHFSRRHGRLQLWPIRLRATWEFLATNAKQSGLWISPLIVPFYHWYEPRLQRRVQELSRRHEFESDRMAGDIAGGEAAGAGLLRISLAAEYESRVVAKDLLHGTVESPEPPADGLSRTMSGLREYRRHPQLHETLRAMLSEEATAEDTHPSLRDRLHALGCSRLVDLDQSQVANFLAEQTPAIASLLSPSVVSRIEEHLNHAWATEKRSDWVDLHTAATVGASDVSSSEVKWARAKWAASCSQAEVAIPIVRDLLQHEPEHGLGRSLLGSLLINSFDVAHQEEGRQLLEAALQADARYAQHAAASLKRHYLKLGRKDEIARITKRELVLQRQLLNTLAERSELKYRDRIRSVRASRATVEHLQQLLQRHPEIGAAWLVEKKTRALMDTPAHFLIFSVKEPWLTLRSGKSAKLAETILEDLAMVSIADIVVVPMDARPRSPMERRLRRLTGAQIYPVQEIDPTQIAAGWSKASLVRGFLHHTPEYLVFILSIVIVLLISWLVSS
jgi:Zn-dependent protease with chaperone function